MSLRPEIAAIADALLRTHPETIPLDAVGGALGALSVSPDEIDHLIAHLEAAGRRVEQSIAGSGTEKLQKVIAAARVLANQTGRAATRREIASHAGLTEDEVAHALSLAKVMQR